MINNFFIKFSQMDFASKLVLFLTVQQIVITISYMVQGDLRKSIYWLGCVIINLSITL